MRVANGLGRNLSTTLRERLAIGVLGTVVTALAIRAYAFAGNDFNVFRTAGMRFLSGADLYPGNDGFFAYRYAPGVALLFSPFAALSRESGKALAMGLIVIATMCAFALVHRRLRATHWLAAPLAVVALVRPLVDELQNVQVNVLALVLILLAFTLEDLDHEVWAGVALAWAVGLKVAPIVVAADWVIHRRWRPLFGLAVGLCGIAALPWVTYGLDGAVAQHLAWVTSETRWSGDVAAIVRNQSVWSLVARLGGGRTAGLCAALLVVAAALTARDRSLRRGLVLLAIPLASAYGWLQNFVFALPLTAHMWAMRGWIRWTAFALALSTAIPTYDVVGRHWEAVALGHTVVGLEMLALFVLARFAAGPGSGDARVASTDPVNPAPDAESSGTTDEGRLTEPAIS